MGENLYARFSHNDIKELYFLGEMVQLKTYLTYFNTTIYIFHPICIKLEMGDVHNLLKIS